MVWRRDNYTRKSRSSVILPVNAVTTSFSCAEKKSLLFQSWLLIFDELGYVARTSVSTVLPINDVNVPFYDVEKR